MNTNPKFTYQELGALVAAVGTAMSKHNLSAGAAQDGNSDEKIRMVMEKVFNIHPLQIEELMKLSIEEAIELSNKWRTK